MKMTMMIGRKIPKFPQGWRRSVGLVCTGGNFEWAQSDANRSYSSPSHVSSSFPIQRVPKEDYRHRYPNGRQGSSVQIERRMYHATRRAEIVPLVVGGVAVLMVARYSLRALRRMQEEWDEYEWELQQYEKQNPSEAAADAAMPAFGIDVGTVHLKLAKSGQILENRAGSRHTFCGIVSDGDETLTGQRALEKFYEKQHSSPDSVKLAFLDVGTGIPVVLDEPLREALDKNQSALDKIRPVVVAPFVRMEDFREAVRPMLPKAIVLPEPVAAVWGAQQQQHPIKEEDPVLVLDVGGYQTSMSVVKRNVVLAAKTWVFGGEDYVQSLVDYVLQDHEVLSQDGMARQRLFTAAQEAVAEFNTQTAAQIHIPYIGMDLQTKQPEHLDMRVARNVIEQMVSRHALDMITMADNESLLSPHMPTPTDMPSMWMSIMTQLLEEAGMTPMQVGHFLLVGGGARQKQIESSVRETLVTLQGNADNLIVPEARAEVMAQGASSMLQNYDYDVVKGLVRKTE